MYLSIYQHLLIWTCYGKNVSIYLSTSINTLSWTEHRLTKVATVKVVRKRDQSMIGNFHELQIWHLNHTSIWHKNLNYIILGDHSPITAKISYTNYSSCSFIRNNLMKQRMLSSSINNTPVLAPLATDLRQHLTFEIIRSSSSLILYQSPSLSFPDHLYPPRFPPHQSAESVSDKDKNKTLDFQMLTI